MNIWSGVGNVKRIYKGSGANGAYAFLSVIPDGDKAHVEVAVWGTLADTLANVNEGDRVKVVGKLGSKKDKKLTEKAKFDIWTAQINVDAKDGGSIAHDGGSADADPREGEPPESDAF